VLDYVKLASPHIHTAESKESTELFDLINRFFGKISEDPAGGEEPDQTHDIRIATCALFLEMAGIDGEFSDSERDNILSMLHEEYGISEEYAAQIIHASKEELEGSTDLWHFTHLINQNYSEEEKIRIVQLMWTIVYADGKLDAHEDYLVHKLAKMLRLNHTQLIEAKLKILHDRSS
jgi:uncharacterized tellurite resistance protein B-like protein